MKITRVAITRRIIRVEAIATRNRLERKGIVDIVRRMAKMNDNNYNNEKENKRIMIPS